ncbi:MAG: autotransporter outer membrane beta-barrel domain-containing protein [Ignavibacteriae bacterium]|nr:MAG: autotransporter outer membrane beta-barrel domain-containing protein [Ignavibacteriota bacterium]
MRTKVLLLMALLFLSSSLYAQSNRFFLNFGTGLSTPMSEEGFTNLYNMGFNLHGGAGLVFSSSVAGRLSLEHNRFPQSSNNLGQSGTFTITSIKADIMAGEVNNIKTVNPYGVAGIGAYILSVSVTENNFTRSESETNMGVGLGGGINFKVSPNMGIYTEAQYNIIFNEDGAAKGFLPIKVGINYIP